MFCVSTIGAWPVTVIVSSSDPTVISALTVDANPELTWTPSRLNVLKPTSVNVMTYGPGRNSTIRYCPWLSVTALRTFSISAGLAASTVTPGSTAPEASRATPAREPFSACADAMAGNNSTEKHDADTREDPECHH